MNATFDKALWLRSHTESDARTGCMLWRGSTYSNGYGHARVPRERKTTGAHRLAYTLFVGAIPDGMDVCHKCDVRRCVNPRHLFVGTRAENIRDASKKRRLSSGSERSRMFDGARSPRSKLSWSDVEDIRAAWAAGEKQCEIAKRYPVTHRTISLVVRRKEYRWAP